MSTKLELKRSWNEVKGKLKQKFGQLPDYDLSFAAGKTDELLGRLLQRRLGESKEDRDLEIVGEVWCPRRSEWICVSRSFLPTA